MKKSTARDLLKQIEINHPDVFAEFCLSLKKTIVEDAHVEINFNDNNMPQVWIEMDDYELTGLDFRPSIKVKKSLASVLRNSPALESCNLDGTEGEKRSENFRALFSRWTKLFTPHS